MAVTYMIQLFILTLDLFVFIRIFTTVETDVLYFFDLRYNTLNAIIMSEYIEYECGVILGR